MSVPPARTRRRGGAVLLVVLFFVVLLYAFVATFLRRATLDTSVLRNRDAMAQAEALARGGVELGLALLVEDALQERAAGTEAEHLMEPWALLGEVPIATEDGGELRVRIEDAGARLNLNALFRHEEAGLVAHDETPVFLTEFLRKVIEEMPEAAEEKDYDPEALAAHLVDYVDADPVGRRGELEDDYYQQQTPPYRAANRPLLSVDELRMVQGFDEGLVEALRPYVTVYPYARTREMGINPNTAPSWVLASVFHGVAGEKRLAGEAEVRRVLQDREELVFCPGEVTREGCAPPPFETVFPPPSWDSDVFIIRAEGRVGDLTRTVEAVIDRTDLARPLTLAWRVE